MWRDFILAIDAEAVCHSPASIEQLTELETVLRVHIPGELAALLQEMNGAEVAYGVSIVWSTEEIAQRNLQLRREWRIGGAIEGCMPVDHLLFFGEAGNGDLFGFPVTPEGVRSKIFVWDHEDDSRICQARSLSSWLQSKQ